MARRKAGTTLTSDEWTLLIDYFFRQPERAHTDSHPDCIAFATRIGLSPQTVDMSLRNIKAYSTRSAGLRKGAQTMRVLYDAYEGRQSALAKDAQAALRRLKYEQPSVPEDAMRRLQRFNARWRNQAATRRRRVQASFDRPSQARADLLSIVGTDCQVCGTPAFTTRNGGEYVETHHLDELAHQRPGNLCTDNVLVVCPACHSKLHYAPMTVSMSKNMIVLRLAGESYRILPNSEENLQARLKRS